MRWDAFCRAHATTSVDARGRSVARPAPIKFIAAGALGALAYVFSDFGDAFAVNDETGEPAVTRTITGVTCAERGVVQLVDPHTSELAQPHNVDDTEHRGTLFARARGVRARARPRPRPLSLSLARARHSRNRRLTALPRALSLSLSLPLPPSLPLSLKAT